MAEKKTIKDLFIDEIKDLYSAEKQLTKAIPKWRRDPRTRRSKPHSFLTCMKPRNR